MNSNWATVFSSQETKLKFLKATQLLVAAEIAEQKTWYLFSHNHGSVENQLIEKRNRILEIHPFSTGCHDYGRKFSKLFQPIPVAHMPRHLDGSRDTLGQPYQQVASNTLASLEKCDWLNIFEPF